MIKKKRNAQDKTKRDSVSRAEWHQIEKRLIEVVKRLDVIESLIDFGKGKFRTP